MKIYNDIEVLVDDDMVEELSAYRWHLSSNGYAVHSVSETKKLFMHQVVLGATHADHINRNKLDNRRQNLRCATRSQNGTNRIFSNPSGLRGVTPHANKWRAQIRFNGEKIYLGVHATVTDAARAYDIKAKELYGEFAITNGI